MGDSLLHRKDRLIITTIEIMEELGIQGLSTREIAKRQGVSEATIFRHYKNKNELIIAVLDYFSQFDNEIFQSTKLKGFHPLGAIQFLISLSVEYYENYPAITSIMQMLDVLRYQPELTDKVKQILYNRFHFIKQLVEEAQTAGEINKNLNSESVAYLITGACREICLRWRMEGMAFSLKETTLSTINVLLKS